MVKKRNQFVDIMRGIAMLFVVFQHTMTGCTKDANNSFLFNIVWSLQMPLFVLISGYVTKYSREISDRFAFWKYLKRRTLSYIFPWIVWSFLVRGVIFGQSIFLDFKWLIWHMDYGYWFLITIWTISVVFGVSTYVAQIVAKQQVIKKQILILIVYIIGMVILAGIGYNVGFSFFAIRLTLYYMPFYITGYLFGQYRDRLIEARWGKMAMDVIVAVCTGVWLFILTRYHIYNLPDRGPLIAIRALSSLIGCIAICGLFEGLFSEMANALVFRGISWCGKHSMEIYLTHYLLLCLLRMKESPIMRSIQGISLILANYLLTIVLTVYVVKMFNTNKTLRVILYGNKG